MLGISRDTFDRMVAPHVRCVSLGRVRVYPVGELETWLDRAVPCRSKRHDDPGSTNRGICSNRMVARFAESRASCGPGTGDVP